MSKFTLVDLENRIKERAAASAEESYTRKLLDRGVDRERVIAESADVLYHLLVVLHARGVTLAEVEATLGARSTKSGLAEKASRPPK
jgi:phosphoribosyl-ATP pyrophosphohydrolase